MARLRVITIARRAGRRRASSALVGLPFLAAAESTGSAAFQLAGTILGGVLFAAPAALITTLLYYDLRARKARR